MDENQWLETETAGVEPGDGLPAAPEPAPIDPAAEQAAGQTSPSDPAPAAQIEEAARPALQPGRSRSARPQRDLPRLTVGGLLLGLDALEERLDEAAALEERDPGLDRTPQSVLVPMSEWESTFGVSSAQSTRHLMLGVMSDARTEVSRGRLFLRRTGNALYTLADAVLAPLHQSRPFRPFRHAFRRLERRGQGRLDRWMELGRTEDQRSRQIAQAAINIIAEDSMDEIADNRRIQLFIQEIVQAQSQGFVDEALEEVRERTVTGDLFLEKWFRAPFGRSPRDSLPKPDFDPRLVATGKHLPPHLVQGTDLGNYAGFTSRLLAFVVDIAFILAFLAAASWLVSNTIQILGLEGFFTSLLSSGTAFSVVGALILSLNGAIFILLYAWFSWGLTGQSLGMMLLGLRVVRLDGRRLTLWQVLRRIIGFILSALVFFLGFIWIMVDNRRQSWADKLAGSIVVYSWPAQPDERFLRDLID